MELQFEEIIKKCFTLWNKDSKTWKYVMAIWAISIVFFIIIAILVLMLFGPIVAPIIENPANMQNPEVMSQLIFQMLPNFFIMLALYFFLVFFFVIATYYFEALIMLRALELNNIKTEPFSVNKFVRLILLGFYVFIAAALSLYNKTLMILTVIYLLLICFSVALFIFIPLLDPSFILLPIIFFLIIFLLMIPYFFIVFYNGLRLSLASAIFLHKEIPITQAAKESWKMTKGHPLMIFIISLVVGIIVGIISQFFYYGGQFVGGLFDLLLNIGFLAIVVSSIVSFIVFPILKIIDIHLMPAIYAQLLGGQEKKQEKPASPVKPTYKPSPYASEKTSTAFKQTPFPGEKVG